MKTVCAIVVALGFAASVVAETINVPAGGDIQAAINDASDGDIIQLEAGAYFPAATIDTLGKAVTLRGVPGKGKDDAPLSVIDGQNSIRVFICESGEGPGTVFENLLITGGLADGDYPDNAGGGMHNAYSSPTLENCTFTGNWAVYGGGMYNVNGSGPTLENCTFTGRARGNWAEYRGGGMYNVNGSGPALTDTTVCSNTPDQIDGPWTDLGGNCVQKSCDDCGVCENDQDGDGVCDEEDGCPNDPNKIDPGRCGCGVVDTTVQGDFDCDGDFDADDYAAMGAELGVCQGGINGDGIVDGADMGLLLLAWGTCLP